MNQAFYHDVNHATESLASILNVSPSAIPMTPRYGWHEGKFNPSSIELDNRLVFLLRDMANQLENKNQ